MRTNLMKKIGVWGLLMVLLVGMIPGIGTAGFADPQELNSNNDGWSKSSLVFLGEDLGDCFEISSVVENHGDGDMSGEVMWELYWAASGNPKDGEVIADGNFGPLDQGDTFTFTYNPQDNPNGPDGNYMFKAYQEDGHPGTGVLWGGQITIEGCLIEEDPGTITVNKTFVGGEAVDVTFELYMDEELIDTKTTEDGQIVFGDLENGTYHLVELMDTEYLMDFVSSLDEDNSYTISSEEKDIVVNVVNRRPDDPEKGSITINKSFSDQLNQAVTFELHFGEEGMMSGETVDGQLVFNNLDNGSYHLVEVAVEGYTNDLPADNSYVIDDEVKDHIVNVINTLIPVDPEKGSLTVTKTFSDQSEAEVTVELYEVTEGGDVLVTSQVTVGHVTTFINLDLAKSYKIIENPVPTGYNASYPDGQAVVFGENNMDSLGILNTLIPVDPEKGSLRVIKSYSNGNTAEVTVDLYQVTGEGDVFIVSQETEGLATTFTNLNIESTYKIVENGVPAGYNVSYPDGQTILISGVEAEGLSILNTRQSGGGGGGGGGGGNNTTTITPEPTPEAVPEVIPEPVPAVEPAPEPMIIEEVVPLGVPVLPKTGELPAELFYGLGGMITALGALLKRK